MKFAVYAISKNEEKNAERFMKSCGDLPVYVLDHSTDRTAEILRDFGAVVDTTPLDPFRFDAAKNWVMRLLPSDINFAINIDLDEIFHAANFDKIRGEIDDDFDMVWHFYKPDAHIDRVVYHCRIHDSFYFEWTLPVHEYLKHTLSQPRIQCVDELLITQYPSKDRKHTWSDRLLAAITEYPDEPRLRMLAGRDLYFDERFDDAIDQFSKYFDCKDRSMADTSYVFCMMAKCYRALGKEYFALNFFEKAVDVYKRRESYVELAHEHMLRGDYEQCLRRARTALRITSGEFSPHYDPGAWSFKPHELISIALYNLNGKIERVIEAAETALRLASGADAVRIKANLDVMRQSK